MSTGLMSFLEGFTQGGLFGWSKMPGEAEVLVEETTDIEQSQFRDLLKPLLDRSRVPTMRETVVEWQKRAGLPVTEGEPVIGRVAKSSVVHFSGHGLVIPVRSIEELIDQGYPIYDHLDEALQSDDPFEHLSEPAPYYLHLTLIDKSKVQAALDSGLYVLSTRLKAEGVEVHFLGSLVLNADMYTRLKKMEQPIREHAHEHAE